MIHIALFVSGIYTGRQPRYLLPDLLPPPYTIYILCKMCENTWQLKVNLRDVRVLGPAKSYMYNHSAPSHFNLLDRSLEVAARAQLEGFG